MNETRRDRTYRRAVSGVRPYVTTLASDEPNVRALRLAALPTAPHLARVFVTQKARQLRLSSACAETAQLLVSELVTNAVKQTGRAEGAPMPAPTETVAVVMVRVLLVDGALRIDVWDSDTSPPVRTEPALDAEEGRGLLLVEALSRCWGCYTPAGRGAVGKVVWAEVAVG